MSLKHIMENVLLITAVQRKHPPVIEGIFAGFHFLFWSIFSAQDCGPWGFSLQQPAGNFVSVLVGADVGMRVCCCVVVEWVHRWACLFW